MVGEGVGTLVNSLSLVSFDLSSGFGLHDNEATTLFLALASTLHSAAL